MSCKAYIAHAMTNRSGVELLLESKLAKVILSHYGIECLDPVDIENITEDMTTIAASAEDLALFWKRDKELIQEADVIIDLTGPSKSEGVAHEIGYGRYCLWMPVCRIYPSLGPSVARFEDDLIAPTLDYAGMYIRKNWGSYDKRLLWRLKMLIKCLPKWIRLQLWRLFK